MWDNSSKDSECREYQFVHLTAVVCHRTGHGCCWMLSLVSENGCQIRKIQLNLIAIQNRGGAMGKSSLAKEPFTGPHIGAQDLIPTSFIIVLILGGNCVKSLAPQHAPVVIVVKVIAAQLLNPATILKS